MDATSNRFANRCLPLRIAAQAGLFVLNSHAVRLTWNGGNATSDIEIESLDGEEAYPAKDLREERRRREATGNLTVEPPRRGMGNLAS